METSEEASTAAVAAVAIAVAVVAQQQVQEVLQGPGLRLPLSWQQELPFSFQRLET